MSTLSKSLCALLILLTTAIHAAELTIIADGRSDYMIAYAADADQSKITEAAELLRDLLARSTGVELPIYAESDAPADAPTIYLGRTQAARQRGLPVDEVKEWSYLMRVVGDDLFLVGEDRAPRPGEPQQGFSGYAGTYKAVTTFLERVAGVRFVLPGRLGIQVPERQRIAVAADLDHSWSPLFDYVVGRRVVSYSGQHEYDPYAIANNYFGRFSNDTHVVWTGGSHTWGDFVPRSHYIDSHPEYFGLFKGKRDPHKRNILCLSNPEVKDLLVQGTVAKMDEGYDYVYLMQADGYIECQCDQCQAIHPDIGEKLWIYHRELAERIYKLRPDKWVVLSAYVTTTKPPLTFDRFPPNVVISNNRYTPEYFAAWEPFETPHAVFFPEWIRRWPRVPPRYAVNLVRLWLENDVIGIYIGGGLDSGHSPWGLNGPSYYAFGKAMEDPTRNADDLEREFVEGAFGEAAEPMLAFYHLMHRRLEIRELISRRGVGNPDRRYRGHPMEMLPGDFLCHFFAPQILIEMSRNLQQARELATTDAVKARLELVEAEFRYLRDAATVYQTFRAYQSVPSWEALSLVRQRVEALRETLAWLQPEGEALHPGGYRQLRTPFNTGWPFKDNQLEMTGDPPFRWDFDWDFDAMREKGELPSPDVRLLLRGGEGLPPYRPAKTTNTPDTANDQPADGFLDPEINAPYDQ